MDGLLHALIAVGILVAANGHAAEFPNFSGRVVDQAGLLSSEIEAKLTNQLADHEQATTNQVVVVTLTDLDGDSIEGFGYELGRHWGIGQEEKNNGALLIVAVAERKVRIEVGYGLEGSLTDATAANIIRHKITPRFKQGRFELGIQDGINAMLAAIAGEYTAERRQGFGDSAAVAVWVILFFVVLIIIIAASRGGRGRGGKRRGRGAWIVPASTSWSSGSWGFGGGGFAGGGSFGGGGASGGW